MRFHEVMSVIGKPVVVIYLGFDLDAGAELLRPPRGVKTGVFPFVELSSSQLSSYGIHFSVLSCGARF